jgi:hypothetical protein
MSTQKHDDVTEFLTKHEYIVKCVVTNNKIECTYNNIFTSEYEIVEHNEHEAKLAITYDNGNKSEFLTLPIYISRWFIFLDILRVCRKYKLSHNIIRFYDKEGDIKDLQELLDIITDPYDIELETNLGTAIVSILSDKSRINSFDDTFANDCALYGFILLKGLLV